MSQIANRSHVQSMTDTQLERLNKAELIRMLRAQDGNAATADLVKEFRDLGASLRKDINEAIAPMRVEVDRLTAENGDLKKQVEDLKSAVEAQQRVLVSHERERRGKNIVVRGLSETQVIGDCNTDEQKVSYVVSILCGQNRGDIVSDFLRLGTGTNDRPVLVKFSAAKYAREALKNGKKLNGVAALKSVFVNPDLTLAENKERGRLWKAYKVAKMDENNRGKAVVLRNGKLSIDGIVVDSSAVANPFLG